APAHRLVPVGVRPRFRLLDATGGHGRGGSVQLSRGRHRPPQRPDRPWQGSRRRNGRPRILRMVRRDLTAKEGRMLPQHLVAEYWQDVKDELIETHGLSE